MFITKSHYSYSCYYHHNGKYIQWILLVDDEPGLRTAVQAYLEDEGFQVTTAVDGEEGWEKAQKMIPDVIISDVMMPRCDGYEIGRAHV